MSKRVGIWIRVSTEDQAQGDSPKHHEHRAKAYADVKGWVVVEEYHLEAVSGKSVINHPEAQRMIDDVKRGHITGLIFSKLARLARNTRELLEFADIFKQYNADLMSLDESIDTSSPAGRFFYTLIAGMAEWERAEIGSRVKASVKTRAQLGKSLGGQAPFGYKWENNKLVVDSDESPIRKYIYELFAEHKRLRRVASVLKEKGFRSRNGKFFRDTSIHRILRDPVSKGLRRANYSESTVDKKGWIQKPKEEWVFTPAPRIVSDELWDSCNKILDEMASKLEKVRRKGVHMFSGIVKCECGSKMYMRSQSPKYVCNNCKNKISPEDLEEIFHDQLKTFLFSDAEIQNHLNQEKLLIGDKEKLLETLKKEVTALKQKEKEMFDLYHEGQIPKETFSDYHTPIYNRQKQIEVSLMELQGQIDALKMQCLDNSHILQEAKSLHNQWHLFTPTDKQKIIETITSSIIVGAEDIEINLGYLPLRVEIQNSHQGYKVNDPYISKTVQLSHKPRLV